MTVYRGALEIKFISIIPFLIFLSYSRISNISKSGRGGRVIGLHLTPFFTIGFNWRK